MSSILKPTAKGVVLLVGFVKRILRFDVEGIVPLGVINSQEVDPDPVGRV